jgi:type IV secretion system protein VirB10
MTKEKELDPSNSPSSSSVLRLNNKPVIIVAAIVIAVIAALSYSLYQREHSTLAKPGAQNPKIAKNVDAVNSLYSYAPANNGLWIKAKDTTPQKPNGPSSGTPSKGGHNRTAGAESPHTPPPAQKLTENQKFRESVLKMQEEALTSAAKARTSVSLGGLQKSNGLPAQPANNAPANQYAGVLGAIKGDLDQMREGGPGHGAAEDANGQSQKVAFMNKGKRMGYLPHKRNAPLSPYEIKTGTIIPAVMISGINSDLPGEIVGQVSQNVYDTATGNYLLIPQGARLIGEYDSHVTYGQNRVLVVWRRIVFPDASTINLDTMPGTDEAGYAGFRDQVDNHYWRIFGQALLVSAFTAGIELSQPQQSNINAYPSTSQQVSAALGQQMGELGMSVAQRNMDIQPTLKIRSGYRYTVLVNKDIILEPYTRMAASDRE